MNPWRVSEAPRAGLTGTADLFVRPTGVGPTVTYRLSFVLVILAPERLRIVHLAVTAHPTAAWTAQQVREISQRELPSASSTTRPAPVFAKTVSEVRARVLRLVKANVISHRNALAHAASSPQRTRRGASRSDFSYVAI
jgi:hypothetical protein